MSQGAMRSQDEPGGQEGPGEARRRQEQHGGARRNQEEPGGAGGARGPRGARGAKRSQGSQQESGVAKEVRRSQGEG
jgi:hypothetical protein